MSRLEEVPIYAQRDDALDAPLYNLWRRARNRRGHPIRLDLDGRPGIGMVLDDETWVCVDHRRDDLPILAWVDIEHHRRSSLHLPVPCKINYYHFAASRLRAAVLDETRTLLEGLLTRNG